MTTPRVWPGRHNAAALWSCIRSKLLWWRHTYTFNWAHKPLCRRFERDVLRIGPVHLCRSCTLLYISAAVALVTLFSFGMPEVILLPTLYALFVTAIALSFSTVYERLPRNAKDAVRCATGVSIALTIGAMAAGYIVVGAANLVIFAAAYRVNARGYAKWKRRACNGCSQSGASGICTGYRRQAVHIRTFEQTLETELIQERLRVVACGNETARR